MKCDRCNGTGRRVEESDNGIGWIPVKCEYCHGTGEVEQTEQEYIQTCNTEQLAEFLADKYNEVVDTVLSDESCIIDDADQDDYWYRKVDIVEWLKKPHDVE